MKTFKTNLLLICTAGILFFSCWKKQEHEIMVPKTPVYNLSGRISCSLTNEPLAGVNVNLTGTVKYNEEDSKKTLNLQQSTDENGMFTFTEVPGGFMYLLDAVKQGYQALTQKLVMYYEDKYIDNLIMGKTLSLLEQIVYKDINVTGITYKDGSIYIIDSLNSKIIELTEDLKIKRSVNFTLNQSLALAWDGEWFWISEPIDEIILKFQINDSGDIKYGKSYPSPKNFYYPDKSVRLLDMSWVDGKIWACSNQINVKYFKFNPAEPEVVTYFDSPMYHPAGIDVDSTKVYLLCHYGNENKLFLLDKDTGTILGFYVIIEDAGLITLNGSYLWLVINDTAKVTLIKYSF